MAQLLGRPVKHDLAAALSRSRSHVDHPVGSEHHRRVVLHHDQRVAGVAQTLHGVDDAAHVARVQPDAGFVEHKQRVHERGAQRRCEVDALHLATAERATLPVQREVADAHVAQVLQAGGDLLVQQFQRLALALAPARGRRLRQGLVTGRRRGLHPVEEGPQPVYRQQHQVVQAQPRQGVELLAAPLHALRQEALRRREHRVGVGLAADAPEQALGLQACAQTRGAGGVAAVLGEQHPDVHLVGLGLQVLEEAFHAEPVLVPLPVPVRRAVDHPVLLLRRELGPRRVARNARGLRVAHQVVLALLPGRRLHRLDGARAQRELVVRNHQAVVDADDPAKALAGRAGTDRRVEGEGRSHGVGIAQVAVRAVQAGGELPDLGLRLGTTGRLDSGRNVDVEPAGAAFQCGLYRLQRARPLGAGNAETVGHHVEQLASRRQRSLAGALACLERLRRGRRRHRRGHGLRPLRLYFGEAAGRQPLLQLFGTGVARQFHRKRQHQARIAQAGGAPEQLGVDGLGRVVAHRQRGGAVEQRSGPGQQQLEVVVELGHRADRGTRRANRVGLVDGDGRWHTVHLVHGGLVHPVQELARVRREGFHVAALPFGKQRVEHQARLAGSAGPGDHGQLAGADVQVEVLQIVLARAADADQSIAHVNSSFSKPSSTSNMTLCAATWHCIGPAPLQSVSPVGCALSSSATQSPVGSTNDRDP